MADLVVYNPTAAQQPVALPDETARGARLFGLAVLAIFFGGFGGWAAVAPLSGAVVAPAVVKVEGNRKSIQHLDGGIVRELRVKEGELVNAGQVVIVLDDSQPRAAVTMLSQQYDVLRAQEARLTAERDQTADVGFPRDLLARANDQEVARIIATEVSQFQFRRTALEGQVSVLAKRSKQLDEQIRGFRAQLASQKKQQEKFRDELDDQHFLLEKGLTQRSKVLQLERGSAAVEGQRGEIEASIAQARQQIGEMDLRISQLQYDRMTDVAKELREVQAKLLDTVPKLQAAQDVLDRTEIRSPYAGLVVGLSVFSVGGVIQRGDRVMDIVPTRNDLSVEANVSVDDIHDVRPGMKAEVHFTAYKQRVVPIIRGEVTQISADRLVDNRSGAPYYTAIVRVDAQDLAESKLVELYPGMAATVMIPTQERTALDYLLGPLVASFDQSFRQK